MIRLSKPNIGDEEFEQIKDVLESGYLVQGDKVEEFESLVKKYLNTEHAIAVSSGTAALHLALLALDIKARDEVIVPDFTFPATANVVEIIGATPKLVDIDINTFCIDINKIEDKITNKTRAIIPVHEFGHSADMDKILELAQKYNLKIVEDAACAFGTEYKNIKVGSIGDIGCFSLHPRKTITTGEGGILVTNNDKLANRLRIMRNHGISNYEGRNDFVMPGLNYRMTNMQGAIGVAQMSKLNNMDLRRKLIVKKYGTLLRNIKGIVLPKQNDDTTNHTWQTYHVLLKGNVDRNLIITKLREKGIEVNYGASSIHEQTYYKQKYSFESNEFPNSSYSSRNGLALPLHDSLSYNEVEYVVQELHKLINCDID